MEFSFEPDLGSDLRPLWDEEARRSFFLSRWWLETVFADGLDEGDVPAFGLLRAEGGKPIALLPGRFVRRQVGPLATRELKSLTGMYSCFYRPIFAVGKNPDWIARKLGASIGRAIGRGGVLHLDAIDADWPELAAFERGLSDVGFHTERYHQFSTWSEKLSERRFDQYLGARDGALREIIRRKGRALERAGRVAYRIISNVADVELGINTYESVYARSWKIPEPYPTFHPMLMRNAARAGALRLGVCKVDATPVAVQLWIAWGRSATVLKLAHDEATKKLSVGSLLTAYMIRHFIIDESVTTIDFGRGDDAYKRLWSSRRHQRIGLIAANPASAAGLFILARQAASRVRRLGRHYWHRVRSPSTATTA